MTRHVVLFRDRGEASEESSQRQRQFSVDEDSFTSSSDISSSLHPPPPPSADPYEWLFASAGFASTSIPVLKYDFVNLDRLAGELADFDKFRGDVATAPYRVLNWQNCGCY